jgi:hypothetical protein
MLLNMEQLMLFDPKMYSINIGENYNSSSKPLSENFVDDFVKDATKTLRGLEKKRGYNSAEIPINDPNDLMTPDDYFMIQPFTY